MEERSLYPLKFEPIYKEKVWGGRRMESALGRVLPKGVGISGGVGESWELVDLGVTSVSGGGGGAERSVVREGMLAGKTLQQVIAEYGEQLLGRLALTEDGGFPLLVKYLDASENLSVQVHPSAKYAREHEGAYLKSEAWYIVEAEPGAVIYKGIKAGVTEKEFRAAVVGGSQSEVEAMMVAVGVKAGDCHYLPSGTCHALGKGLLVAEVQTPSDTTFRVYDWGRKGRELHLEEAMACIDFGGGGTGAEKYEKRTHIAGFHTTVSRLVTCEFFRIEKVRMGMGYEQEIPYDQPAVWMVLQGRGEIKTSAGSKGEKVVKFSRGETLLMPAKMKDAVVKLEEDTVWLEVTFPQAMGQVIA